MKIISFSDIHLEFPKKLRPPPDDAADLMILSGDIINLHKPEPLGRFLDGWRKPILYVPGNHEYYTRRPMMDDNAGFRDWFARHYPAAHFLVNESITISGVNFFGGTMWTDFGGGDPIALEEAPRCMADYRLIRTDAGEYLKPEDTIAWHDDFVKALVAWFETPLEGPRVVITHHAPVLHPQSAHTDSLIIPAFNSLDMPELIEKYQPDYWFYGHTHECDRQMLGRTQIISNQLGYAGNDGKYECQRDFDPAGAPIVIDAGARKKAAAS